MGLCGGAESGARAAQKTRIFYCGLPFLLLIPRAIRGRALADNLFNLSSVTSVSGVTGLSMTRTAGAHGGDL